VRDDHHESIRDLSLDLGAGREAGLDTDSRRCRALDHVIDHRGVRSGSAARAREPCR
jgi:hypothetical protein